MEANGLAASRFNYDGPVGEGICCQTCWLEPTWYQDRNNTYKLFSDLHVSHAASPPPYLKILKRTKPKRTGCLA